MTRPNDSAGFTLKGSYGYGDSLRLELPGGLTQFIEFGTGLTKREYFAAMVEDIPWNVAFDILEKKHPGADIQISDILEYRSRYRVLAADALIKALNETK